MYRQLRKQKQKAMTWKKFKEKMVLHFPELWHCVVKSESMLDPRFTFYRQIQDPCDLVPVGWKDIIDSLSRKVWFEVNWQSARESILTELYRHIIKNRHYKKAWLL